MYPWYMGAKDDGKDKEFFEFLSKIQTAWDGFEDLIGFIGECVQPKLSVELGAYKCYSSILIGGITDGYTYALDKWEDPEVYKEAKENLAEAKRRFYIDDIYPVRMDFTRYYSERNWKGDIDLVHIDGDHSYNSVRGDFDRWSNDLSPEGIILMHDVYNRAFPGPMIVLKEESDKWLCLGYNKRLGLGILTKDMRIYSSLIRKFPEIEIING